MAARPRVAVVGVSHWHAARYIEAMRARGVELVGASDTSHQAGAAASQRLGIDFYGDTESLLSRSSPNLAVVLPRHDRATEEIRIVAAHQVAMLVEKPMGLDANQTLQSVTAIEAAGVFASLCLPNRYMAIWDEVAALRASDSFGAIRHAHFRSINGPASRYRDWGVGWMLEKESSGGGCLRNLGIHGIDAAIQLTGHPDLSILGAHCSQFDPAIGVEEFAAASLVDPHGAFASIEAGYSYANFQEGGDYEWRIVTSEVHLKESNGWLWTHRRGHTIQAKEVPTPHKLYQTMTPAALDAFLADRPPPVPVQACQAAVALQDRIYAAGIFHSPQQTRGPM